MLGDGFGVRLVEFVVDDGAHGGMGFSFGGGRDWILGFVELVFG